MAETTKDDPWGDFWALNSRGAASGGESGGCLPQRLAGLEQAQVAIWSAFAKTLPDGTRALDLATGDGRVLRWMQSTRSDLSLAGIDLAPKIPPAPPGTDTRGGVAMESLPFDADTFGAVVSQFGFEYGDVTKVATEIARVLRTDGKVALMVHRGDGPILEHNRKRQRELLWPLKEKSLARKAKALLQEGAGGIDKAAKLASKVAEQGAKRFGQSSPAWEIPEAIKRSCVMGRRAGAGSIIETIGMIEGHARNELGRIQSLGRACATADKRDKLVSAFAAHGLELSDTRPVKEPSGREFADFITFG